MSLIIAENVGLRFGDHEVLRAVSFRIAQSDRIGLVGANGEGKTCLLRIIGGMLESTTGDVHRRRGLTAGYLPQNPPAPEGRTVHDTMLDVFADVRKMEDELHELAGRMGDDAAAVRRYAAMESEFEALGGYGYTTRIRQVLTGLGFGGELWDRPLAQLSGGERTRAYLAALLLRQPDVLLLDEPTNHLDIDSCEWLERWLGSFRGALVIVSHDRYMLDRVTAATWELAFRGLETYKGSYTKFLKLRDARYNERMRTWAAQQEYIVKTREFIRIHIAGQRSREAQGRRKRLERFLRDEAIDEPQEQRAIHLEIPAGKRTGDLVLRAADLDAGYAAADPLLHVDRLEVERGQRIAIVGPNGSGKTTLLRTLLGELDPLDGEVRHGANVSIGYLSQTHAELDPHAAALDAVRESTDGCTSRQARSLLGALLLSGDDVFKRTSELSGGQRTRVVLARLALQEANVLMLDEPTNHLDISSLEIIHDALKRFDGTILLVSHDRYLVEALATHIWAIDGGAIHAVRGGWEKYLEWRAERREERAAERPAETDQARPARSKEQRRKARKDTTKLRRRLDKVEREIEAAEDELEKLNRGITLASESGAMESLRHLSREHQELSARLDKLWEQWEEVGSEWNDST